MSKKKYSKDHEWIELNQDIATVGITNHAQESLGDIVFVDLPEINKIFKAGNEVCVIESVKAASDIYCPIDGQIQEINLQLTDNPVLVNKDPESSGWIFKLKISNSSQFDTLMTLTEYENFLKDN